MCCKGLLKKVIPFFLTFAVGLFIASLFVSVAAPSFSFNKRGWGKHREHHRQINRENRELRLENSRLEQRIRELEQQKDLKPTFESNVMDLDVPPPMLAPVPRAKTR
jgi:hypothetical protein